MMEKEHHYQVVLDDGQFFYVIAPDRKAAYEEAVALVQDCEIHDRGEV
jgi:hypothetical protein